MSWGVMAQQMGWGSSMEEEWRKGPWTAEEDRLLIEYVKVHGEGRWNNVSRLAGLKRNGKSCRLRWVNYLRPDLKRGQITPHEESIIHELHARWGNRWSTIARSLPGRTDNEIKNYWRTHFKKKDKSSPESPEKSRARLLKRQQFQLQQQQKHQYEQHQLNEMDMKRMAALLDESTDDSFADFAQEMKQETAVYPGVQEDQGFLYSDMIGYTNVPEASGEDVMWDGLWNLEEFHGNMMFNNRANYQPTVAANFC